MIITYSKNNVPIRITKERWGHITRRHPELKNQREKVVETISNPDFIQDGDLGELIAGHFFSGTPLTQKYLIAAYKEISDQDEFIITAYFTNAPLSRRTMIWKR